MPGANKTELFQSIVYDPGEWFQKASDLYRIYEMNRDSFADSFEVRPEDERSGFAFEFNWFLYMICGLCLENMIKGLIIKKYYIKNGKERPRAGLPIEVHSHNLVKLIENYNEIHMDTINDALLDRLYFCVRWKGRYPSSSIDADIIEYKEIFDDDEVFVTFLSTCSRDDLRQFEDFYRFLRRQCER